jgi:hypothetical protein
MNPTTTDDVKLCPEWAPTKSCNTGYQSKKDNFDTISTSAAAFDTKCCDLRRSACSGTNPITCPTGSSTKTSPPTGTNLTVNDCCCRNDLVLIDDNNTQYTDEFVYVLNNAFGSTGKMASSNAAFTAVAVSVVNNSGTVTTSRPSDISITTETVSITKLSDLKTKMTAYATSMATHFQNNQSMTITCALVIKMNGSNVKIVVIASTSSSITLTGTSLS